MRVPLSWLRGVRRSRAVAGGARRAPDAARDGGQGDRAAGRGLAQRRRRRAALRGAPPARRPAVADPRDASEAASRSRSCAARRTSPPASGSRWPCPGAVLPGDRRIERTEKMGAVSNGMLCSGEELRLTGDGEGILILPGDAPLGVALADLYGDVILDVDVKPNRGDALSIVGLAREVAAVTGGGPPLPGRLDRRGGRPDRRAAPRRGGGSRPLSALRGALGGRRPSVGPSPDRVQMRLARGGDPADQQRRRCVELRHGRARQADPHLRCAPPSTTAGSSSGWRGPASGSRRSTTSSASCTPRPS